MRALLRWMGLEEPPPSKTEPLVVGRVVPLPAQKPCGGTIEELLYRSPAPLCPESPPPPPPPKPAPKPRTPNPDSWDARVAALRKVLDAAPSDTNVSQKAFLFNGNGLSLEFQAEREFARLNVVAKDTTHYVFLTLDRQQAWALYRAMRLLLSPELPAESGQKEE